MRAPWVTCIYRGALCIPAFEIVIPEAPAAAVEEEEEEGVEGGQEGRGKGDTVFAPEYNYEDLDYTVKPDFVDTVSLGGITFVTQKKNKKKVNKMK